MDTITIERDNDRDIRFIGVKIGFASSQRDQNAGPERWTELTLYRTAGGKLIARQVGRTQWDGEQDRNQVVVCDDNDAVIEFFGAGWLAKEIYDCAGIEYIEDVE